VYCSSCGKECDQGAAFCAGCGAPLAKPTQTSVASAITRDSGKGMSVASLVLGLLALFPFSILTGIPAAIAGHKALRRKSPGRGMAIAGLTMGWLSIAIVVPVAIVMLVTKPRNTGASARSNSVTTTPAVDSLRLKHPDWDLNVCKGILKHGVWSEQDDGSWHGMTHEQLKASWGNPSHVRYDNKYVSILETRSDEQWTYDGKPWIIADDGRAIFYFRDGVLIGWQGVSPDEILFMNVTQ